MRATAAILLPLAATTTLATAQVAYMDNLGRQWRQLTGTTGLTWNQVAAVCPTDGVTPAVGTLGSANVTGWIWATPSQLAAMYADFVPALLTTPTVGGPAYVLPGLAFFGSFTPTWQYYTTFGGYQYAGGWTASASGGIATLGAVSAQYPVFDGSFTVAGTAGTTSSDAFRGVWLWRQSPFHNLGNGLAGTNGVAILRGAGTLVAGDATTLTVPNGLANAPAALAVGLGAVNLPLFGGTLVPSPDIVLGLGFDQYGQLAFAFPWPAGMQGLALHAQCWFLDSAAPQLFAASTALRIDG